MANWIELKKGRYLTVDDMTAINNNFQYLRDYFLSFGIDVPTLRSIAVSYNISPADIQQKFNDVEYNIQIIDEITKEHFNIENHYFKIYTWDKNPGNIKEEIYRWIDWLNEMKNITIKS